MPPKAFPFPIGVGSDVCLMRRVGHIVLQPLYLNLFVRKVFTRLEWPSLLAKISRTGAKDIAGNHDYAQRESNRLPILHLPKITGTLLNGTEKSAEGQLVRYLAGRWAAKEAAIKAHRRRRLFMGDISVTVPQKRYLAGLANEKAWLLVDPPRQKIVMDEGVAKLRGLRCLSEDTTPNPVPNHPEHFYGEIWNGEFVETRNREAKKFFTRRARIEEQDRQLAEVSISHDGEYAMAVCIALDEEVSKAQQKPLIIDKGSGDPLHEPEWADKGWISPTDVDDEDVYRDD